LVAVAFRNMADEKSIRAPSGPGFGPASWQKVSFPGTPEGLYSLRIKARQEGVAWDRIFITFDERKQPAP
jgi:hypothetical protein